MNRQMTHPSRGSYSAADTRRPTEPPEHWKLSHDAMYLPEQEKRKVKLVTSKVKNYLKEKTSEKVYTLPSGRPSQTLKQSDHTPIDKFIEGPIPEIDGIGDERDPSGDGRGGGLGQKEISDLILADSRSMAPYCDEQDQSQAHLKQRQAPHGTGYILPREERDQPVVQTRRQSSALIAKQEAWKAEKTYPQSTYVFRSGKVPTRDERERVAAQNLGKRTDAETITKQEATVRNNKQGNDQFRSSSKTPDIRHTQEQYTPCHNSDGNQQVLAAQNMEQALFLIRNPLAGPQGQKMSDIGSTSPSSAFEAPLNSRQNRPPPRHSMQREMEPRLGSRGSKHATVGGHFLPVASATLERSSVPRPPSLPNDPTMLRQNLGSQGSRGRKAASAQVSSMKPHQLSFQSQNFRSLDSKNRIAESSQERHRSSRQYRQDNSSVSSSKRYMPIEKTDRHGGSHDGPERVSALSHERYSPTSDEFGYIGRDKKLSWSLDFDRSQSSPDGQVSALTHESYSPSEYNEGEEKLSWRLDPKESLSDMSITIVNKDSGMTSVYNVHKKVLAKGPRRSKFFAQLIKNMIQKSGEASNFCLELPESAANVFPVLLDYFYGDNNVQSVQRKCEAFAAYDLAQHFEMSHFMNEVAEWFEGKVRLPKIVDFVDQIEKFENSTALVRVAVELCANNLDRLSKEVAGQLGAKTLLMVLERSWELNYVFHINTDYVTDLVLECVHEASVDREMFYRLTDRRFLPVLEPRSALKLLIVDDEFCEEVNSRHLTCLQRRCVRSLVHNWESLCDEFESKETMMDVLTKLQPHVLAAILIGTSNF